MKRLLGASVVIFLVLGLTVVGCGQKKAASSSEAIEAANAMETVQQKVDYLIGQAKAFYNSKEYQKAIDTAQYVLAYLDKNSQEAKNLLEKARDQLEAAARKTVDDVKKKMGNFGQ